MYGKIIIFLILKLENDIAKNGKVRQASLGCRALVPDGYTTVMMERNHITKPGS